MITAPAAFTAALNQNSRHFDAKIIHSGAEVDCDIQSIGSKKGAQDGQTFSLGSVFSSSAEITCSGLTDNLLNEDIEIQIGILLSDGTYSYITYGHFTVISAPKTAYQTILSCVGFISSKFNLMLPSVGDSPTISTIAQAIQTATGISVTFPGISSGLGNALAQTLSGVTCRTALAIIAFLVGGYATENASGGVEIHQYKLPQARQPVLAENCLSAPIVSEERFEMTGIKVIVNSEAYILTTDTTVDASKTYYERTGTGASDDPYIYTPVESPVGNPASQGWYEVTEIAYSSGSPIRQTYSSPYMTQAIFNNFASAVVGLAFDPAEINDSLGNPLFEPWDCLTVTDVDGSTQYTVPCHIIKSNFDGGFFSEIWSIGESLSDLPVEGSLTQKVDETVQQLATTQAAAEQAKAAATSARTYAEEARETTDEINAYAETVSKTVTQILQDGEEAGQNAQEAKESAENASEYAARALGNLSTVQSVTETLNWITQHGTMTLTSDVALDPTHVYFIREAGGDYHVGSYYYSVVTEPDVADIATYYVLSIDESLNNYVATHLAVDSEGLWILPDSGGNKVLIATGNGSTYTTAGTYIVSGSTVLAEFTASGAQIGQTGESHLEMDHHSMQLVDKEGSAYFWASDLRQTDGNITETFNGDGSTHIFYVSVPVSQVVSVVIIRGETTFTSQYSRIGKKFNFTDYTPASGEIVKIIYTPSSTHTDVFTLGMRKNSTPKGMLSVAEGYLVEASGDYSHASGYYSEAKGDMSFAIGEHCIANSIHDFVGGYYSKTNGNGFAFGQGLEVRNGAIAFGSYNYQRPTVSYTEEHYVFMIGNGTGSQGNAYSKSNVFAIDGYGDIFVQLITDSGTGTTDGDLYAAITALGWQNDVIE